MHFFFGFFKSLKYNAFVSFNLRSLIDSSKTIDFRMHTGWIICYLKTIFFGSCFFSKTISKKIAFVRTVDQVKDILKLQVFPCSHRCHYVYQLQTDSLFDH